MKKPYSEYIDRDEYRRIVDTGLVCWHTEHMQTELLVCADMRLEAQAKNAVVSLRSLLDGYIAAHPAFGESFAPVGAATDAPDVVKNMCAAGAAADVGPMAAVAGAFAAHIGQEILRYTPQVIVENGGDVYMKTNEIATAAIYAGQSPLSMKLGIEVDARQCPVAVCTSSGSIGHSKSFGNADAAVVLSHDACLADACATRLGNEIGSAADVERALNTIGEIEGVIGAVAVIGDMCGAVGHVQLKNL